MFQAFLLDGKVPGEVLCSGTKFNRHFWTSKEEKRISLMKGVEKYPYTY